MAGQKVTVAVAVVTAFLGFALGKSCSDGKVTGENVAQQIADTVIDSPTVPIAGSPARGAKNAVVTAVVFADLKTPATLQVLGGGLKSAFEPHAGKTAVVYKAFPLKQNPESLVMARAVAAAHLQGKAWEMIDAIVSRKPEAGVFDDKAAEALAGSIGIKHNKRFANDMASDKVRDMINADIELGRKLGVAGTPDIFLNGRRISFAGNVTNDAIRSAVNAEVKRMEYFADNANTYYMLGSVLNPDFTAAHPGPAANDNPSADRLGRPIRGASDALVTIIEYSDYQCPFCARAEKTVSRILKEYPDSVRVVFNHNPLPFHKQAHLAHQAAHAAGLQGKFWEMHDMLFDNQKKLGEADILGYAEKLGLDMAKFKTDLKAESTVSAVDSALKIGEQNGVSGTPHFLVNGRPIRGAQPYEEFKKVIDESLISARKIRDAKHISGDALYDEIMKSAPAQPAPSRRALPAPAGRVLVDMDGAPVLGDESAPVTIVEFTDFQCPFCSRANATVHELIKNNPGKIKLVFMHFPLPFHKQAEPAHRAAEAAGMQGKFWEMYDLLFANQKKLGQEALESYASSLGLDIEKFKADMESEPVKQRVAKNIALGRKYGVSGTPAFYLNGTKLSGAQPIDKFQAALNEELKTADKYSAQGVAAKDLYKHIVEASAKPAPVAAK